MKSSFLYSSRWILLLLTVTALLHGVCLASEAPGGESDIFSGSLFTAIFNLVLFLVVLAVLGKWAWQPLLNSMQKREDFIKRTIAEAEAAKEQADRSLKTYESKLKLAEEEARRILAQNQVQTQQITDKMLREAREQADEIRRQTKAEIDHARETALKDIYRQIGMLATDLAGQIVQKSLNADDHKQLIQQTLEMYRQKRY